MSATYGAAVERLIRAARAVERAERTGTYGDGRTADAARELSAARRELLAAARRMGARS